MTQFNSILSVILAFGLWSCNSKDHDQKSVVVAQQDLVLNRAEGIVYFNGIPYSGIARKSNALGIVIAETNYNEGKKHGKYTLWYAQGLKSFEAQYINGKRHGKTYSWWKNGRLRSEANYEHGIAQGKQLQWYKSGQLFKELNLKDGREQGMQRAWRENGAIYNNYEAKNGRIFGLKRATLCYELEDEEVQFE